jgi:mannose-6-phosphate isomerase-like protein (cupin superfamily)
MKNVTLKLTLLSLMIIGLILPGLSQTLPVGTRAQTVQTSSPRSGLSIYDQLYPLGFNYINSQFYTNAGSAANSCLAADDFVVPTGSNWGVRYIDVTGVYYAFTGTPIDALNIRFYNNNSGVPGAEVYSFTDYTNYNEVLMNAATHTYKYEIMLPNVLNFTPGRYWISVQAISNTDITGQWGWSNRQGITIEQEYVWKNPDDGFGMGAIDWTPASMLPYTWSNFNLSFALYGDGMDNDLSMQSIDNLENAPGLTSSETISVTIKNEGTGIETGFDVSYAVNGGTPVVENVGSLTLVPNERASYTFTTTADLSAPGQYNIIATVNLAGDPQPANNQADATIYNLGTVYEMPATGTQTITSCGATFTDSGGLDGNFGMNDDAVTTILPANPGDRIRLTFLEFNASYGGFKIYNGTTTNAPLIGNYNGTNSPGEITALNPEGALTIHFMGPGWEETSGWVAYISCVTPVANDFAILNLNSSLFTIFENNTTLLSTTIQNYGTLAQDKTVTFKANDVVIGTLQTGMLASTDTVFLEMPWTPTVSGSYVIEVSIPADEGPAPDNSMSINPYVYPFDAFFEDFEGETFPPEGWIAGDFWAKNTYSSYSGNNSVQAHIPAGYNDTLITRRLELGEGAAISFFAVSSLWWPGDIAVLWKEEGSSEWITVMTPTMNAMQFTNYTVDLSAMTGQVGRLGFRGYVSSPFAWEGQITLDFILGQNVSVYFDDFDLKAVNITGDKLYRLGETSEFEFTIKNTGLETIPGTDYRVKLMRGTENPLEVYSVIGEEIAPDQQLMFNLSYTFGFLGEYEIYAEVEFAGDQFPSNNKSKTIMLSGLPAQSLIVQVGESNFISELPIDMNFNNSLSESIYHRNQFDTDGGVIFGITYDYIFKTAEPNTAVRVWMSMTSREALDDVWIPAGEMTLVYDGTINFITGEQIIYIPFQVPFNYNDTSMNIAIMVERIGDHTNDLQSFAASSSAASISKMYQTYTNPPDPYNPPPAGQIYWSPFIRLIFNDNLGTVSGNVSDPEGLPIEGAAVTIDPLRITVSTDASGNYEIPYVPEGSYPATASKYTYPSVTQELEVNFGQNTQLDFVMGQLALVTVSGTVVANDNNEPVENALITLSGFASYTTASDATGNFMIENVYSQSNYSLMIEADGYETYIVPVHIELENIELGEIVLVEALIVPYQIITSPVATGMDIDWQHPSTSADQVWVFDDGAYENGWAGETGEEVWIGNLIKFENPATITGFDIYWAKYNISSTIQSMRLDVFDAGNNLIVSSNWFNSGNDQWIHVSVPNITLYGDHYAMVYWNCTPDQSTYLAWDSTNIVNELARYKYPGSDIAPFSNIIGIKGNMLIRPNVLTSEATTASSRELTGYNISRGKLDDIANAADWPLLNSETFTESHFNDTTWPPNENDWYVYAVKAHFTTGESEYSFSTAINYLGVNTPTLDLMHTTIYPNPATDRVFITGCADSDIMIFSMDGRLISQKHSNDSSTSINVSHFASGYYLLVIKNTTGLKQHKLLVQ